MSAAPRVLLWVQHLVGVGHQRRASALARALAGAGARVRYVSGGLPVAGLDLAGCELHQLPAARSRDMRYHTLVDAAGRAVDERWRARRRDELLAVVADFAPQVVITETWPFGRGLLRFELEPLMHALEARRPRPLLLGSVRDIVERRREPQRYLRMARRVRRHFHAVLVHGDPALLPFEESFPPAHTIAERLHYTGYVSTRAPRAARGAHAGGPVLVSAGGGFFGERLLATALEAAALERGPVPRPWHVLAGPNLPQPRFRALVSRAAPHVTVERNRDDFHDLLDRCGVSVSQAGYNTVVDLLAARAPAVLVPYRDDREQEQAVRARHLARHRLAVTVDHDALDARSLRAAVAAARGAGAMAQVPVDLDGARTGARLVLALSSGEVAVAEPGSGGDDC